MKKQSEKEIADIVLSAIKKDDSDFVAHLLAVGLPYDNLTSYFAGTSPLSFCFKFKAKKTLDLLLKLDISLDEKDQNDHTPLMNAILLNDYELVKKILDKDCDLSVQNAQGFTASELAYEKQKALLISGDVEEAPLQSIQEILGSIIRAEHNKKLRSNQRILSAPIPPDLMRELSLKPELEEFLGEQEFISAEDILKGEDPVLKDALSKRKTEQDESLEQEKDYLPADGVYIFKKDSIPVNHKHKQKKLEVIDEPKVVQKAKVTDNYQSTLLVYKKCCEETLEKKDLSIIEGYRASNGEDILMVACKLGNIEIVKKLLDSGVSTELRDKKGSTALMYAVRGNQFEICELLLKHKAKVNTLNSDRESAISIALENDYASIVKLLINSGANLNIRSHGYSLLMQVAGRGQTEMVKLLVLFGASPFTQDFRGMRAGDHALKNGHKTLSKFLKAVEMGIHSKNSEESVA